MTSEKSLELNIQNLLTLYQKKEFKNAKSLAFDITKKISRK